ncbi:MAG: 8-amino-7-oxononanoate synthase [Cyanobacteriota bacterium]|nr:8-amino-7-oxononanoate synthase [Cyanobacteriota bacterium]
MPEPYAWITRSLSTIRSADWYRSVQTLQGAGTIVTLNGRSLINFASNDYLGLASDRRLIEAAIAATRKYGTGSTGSRLLSGHREIHRDLERAIASLKQTEDALVFSSGYLANLGTIAALVGQRDLILGDRYNHSSLKSGATLSGATPLDYEHNNLEDLRSKLEKYRKNYRRCLITTDTVFSMDGDLCPLPQLLDIARAFDCMVLADEAHATGVMGETGTGCVEYFHCTGRSLVQMGTLSKALGSLGGYVAGSGELIDYLRNRAPSWIYTTGLSPADTAAALAAVEISARDRDRRAQLWRNINYLKQHLLRANIDLLPSESPILCIGLKTPKEALLMAEKLKEAGIFAPAIRPPTVPTSRLRLSVMATHELEHLQKVVDVVKSIQ